MQAVNDLLIRSGGVVPEGSMVAVVGLPDKEDKGDDVGHRNMPPCKTTVTDGVGCEVVLRALGVKVVAV